MRRPDHLLLVGLGGVGGATVRWFVAENLARSSFPWHTLLVNVVGCLLLGVVMARATSTPLSRLLGVGFCGGLTTFSTFTLEIVDLVDRGLVGTAIWYLVASLVLGIVAFVATFRTLRTTEVAA